MSYFSYSKLLFLTLSLIRRLTEALDFSTYFFFKIKLILTKTGKPEEPVNEVEDVPNSRVEVPQVGQVLSAMEEAQMGQLDDSSIRQIERILCL